MAKQLVNPVERHLEKGVLAVAGLILIGVIARFLVTSPNQLELSNEAVTPGTIDEKVAAKAGDVRQRLADYEPPIEIPPPLFPEFASALDPFSAQAQNVELPPAAIWQPPVPIIGRVGPVGQSVDLVEAIPLPKPIVETGRSTFGVDRKVGDQTVEVKAPVNWATVTSVFNRLEQLRRHKSTYRAGREEVVVLGTEVQRRARRPDGQWSDGDWETVQPFIGVNVPNPPNLTVVTEEGRSLTPAEQLRALDAYKEAINQSSLRRELVRPLFPASLNGTAWKTPIWPGLTVSDLARQDDELLHPKDPPAASPECLYPECGGLEKPKEVQKELTPQEKVAQLFKDAEAYYDKAKKERSLNDVIKAQNCYADIITNPVATPADKARAKRMLEEPAQLERDIRREIEKNKGRGPAPGAEGTTPSAPTRALLPTQQVWAHDLTGGLRGGRTYQYRMRTVLLNQYAGQPKWLSNPDDAAKVLISGPWSEPSDPVEIEPEIKFYLTQAEERGEKVRAEMYRWFDGVWVKARAEAGIGDVLRIDEAQVEVPIPGDPYGVDRPRVRFDTGAMVLDIDFAYSFRPRKDMGRSGVKFDRPATSAVVTFVDADGHVFERLLDLDLSSPDRKVTKERVWQPKAKPEEKPKPKPRLSPGGKGKGGEGGP